MNFESISRREPTHIRSSQPDWDNSQQNSSTLRAGLTIVWKGRLILAAFLLTGMLLTSAYALLAPPVYQSTATLILQPTRTVDNKGLDTPPGDLDLIRVDSELSIIKSERLLFYVFEKLDLARTSPSSAKPSTTLLERAKSLLNVFNWFSGSSGEAGTATEQKTSPVTNPMAGYETFAGRVSAQRIGQSFVIAITYSSPDAHESTKIANSVASAYLFQSVERKYKLALAGAEVLQGRLNALSAEVNATSRAVATGTLPDVPIPDADARIIGAPQVPLLPAAPKKRIVIAFGAVLGLTLGIGFLAMRALFDRRVHDERDLVAETGIPCLGVLPITITDKGSSMPLSAFEFLRPDQRLPYISAIRDLRTTIELTFPPAKRPGNFVVAIACCDEFGTGLHIAAGLSELIVRSGRHASILYDNDPQPARMNGTPAIPSLADAVLNGKSLSEAVLRTNSEIAAVPIHSPIQDVNLYADFQSPTARRIVESISSHGDLIIALPALSKSAIGLALSTYADAVIIVAVAEKSTKDDVMETYKRFHQIGANVIGTVIGKSNA